MGINATVKPVNEESARTPIEPSGTAMKPETAAKKLGIYFPACPEEFRTTAITHAELKALRTNPPEWLTELRAHGPHPRPVVADKLGITIAALKRNEMDVPMTTAAIDELISAMPSWLAEEREKFQENKNS
ncbi:hypothetical protein CCICO_07630 [Corynebacterium ciconiae DSM 44920]|uniref:DUF5997 family protein n=1 Tax=Corynebacterium ciconiae TaxID=227319 RepID=UPI0003738892|nr:DUF5997 family protein [Corynebacterium ciconiae]WKD61546.1 hypothetical protein CCICO_07630 [Corynebacterium ciconiae DSM 44920]